MVLRSSTSALLLTLCACSRATTPTPAPAGTATEQEERPFTSVCASSGAVDVKVATANSYFGGELPPGMRHVPGDAQTMFRATDHAHEHVPIERTWGTLDQLFLWVASEEKAAVFAIGERPTEMQQPQYDAFALERLVAKYGATWKSASDGVFFDGSKLSLVQDLGGHAMTETERHDLARTENDGRKRIGHAFLFAEAQSKKTFVFVSAGLPAHYFAAGTDAKKTEAQRVEEATVLRTWVNLLEPRDRPRVIAGDLNDIPGSAVHKKLLADFDDGDPLVPEHVALFDFILWDRDGNAGRKSCGFAHRVETGREIGSDHHPRVATIHVP